MGTETKVSKQNVVGAPVHNQALIDLIADIARSSAAQFARQLKPHGLTPAALGVLDYLLRSGAETTQADLARSATVAQASMALVLNRMERVGLIQRHPNPADARQTLIAPTPVARKHRRYLAAARKQLEKQMTDALHPDELAELRRLLHKLTRGAPLPFRV